MNTTKRHTKCVQKSAKIIIECLKITLDIFKHIEYNNDRVKEGSSKAMAKIAYIRVSTKHQKGGIERQEYRMPKDIDKTFTDEASGKDTDRPEFQKMLDYVREGDVVYFESFSRISRSLPDLLNTLDYFSKKGVAFVSVKENIDTSGAAGKLIVSVLGAINAYEREINAERREYGYRKALEADKVGRPTTERTQAFVDAYKEWKAGRITATEATKRAGVSRATFYKMAKQEQEEG